LNLDSVFGDGRLLFSGNARLDCKTVTGSGDGGDPEDDKAQLDDCFHTCPAVADWEGTATAREAVPFVLVSIWNWELF
jgi:hypothetical protein